jgi:uncharacterized protein CbrC (UPF0167 family)
LIGANGSGSYAWQAPFNLAKGSDYAIRITSIQNSSIKDMSDNYFTVTEPPQPNITVTQPNGAETWQAGTSQTIRWNYAGNTGLYARIELLKAGIVKSVIAYAALIGANGSGSYAWQAPFNLAKGSDYAIRITSVTNNSIRDASDNYFAIT